DDDDDDTSDPDRDGVSTADENAAGTDPHDPASAPAWHPEWSASPRLILDRDGWETVRERWNDTGDLATALRDRIRATASAAPLVYPADPYDLGVLEANAQRAKARAVAALMDDDPVLATEAARICAEAYSDMRAVELIDYDKGTIQGGQALAALAQTWDLLEGFGLASPTWRAHCRDAIAQIADDLWDYYVDSWPVILRLTQNNHNIKLASGLGMAGFALNDRPVAARYVNHALTQATYYLFDRQNCDGGCQAEGPNYLDYTMLTFWPFAIAYHNFAAGEAYPYHETCATRLEHLCRDEILDIADPMDDPRLAEILRWRQQVTMPTGWAAPIDDSNHSCGYHGLAAALTDDPHAAYLFETSPECRHASGGLEVELFAYADAIPVAEAPTSPSICLPEAGQAVLRTGWGADDAFALVQGEHGRARVHGFGHEQTDATSFIWHALGETFAMDSGYIGFRDRDLVAHAANHNVILVDGVGAPEGVRGVGVDVDAFLDGFYDTPEIRQVRVRAHYRGTDFERRVGLVPGAFFYVLDRITANWARTFTWLFHANAGPGTDGVFEPTPGGARIVRPLATMDVHVAASPVSPSLQVAESVHGFGHGQIAHHAVLEAIVSGTTPLIGAIGAYSPASPDAAQVETLDGDPNQVAFVVLAGGVRHVLGFSRVGSAIDL
ncbi:MAG: heparinase II/III family protein, partial [Deltaproteobacteria bacterium]|nr:heparinase II/III family protein [Deltaproteobacteria bacterium]